MEHYSVMKKLLNIINFNYKKSNYLKLYLKYSFKYLFNIFNFKIILNMLENKPFDKFLLKLIYSYNNIKNSKIKLFYISKL